MLTSRLCCRAAASRPCISTAYGVSSSFKQRPRGSVIWQTKRVFVSTPQHRKVDARIQPQEVLEQREPKDDSVKPENVKKEEPAATKNDPLLAEQTVSNKEQRQADWAIIKDMAHYIWPKDDFGTRFRVGLSVALLVGAKVCPFSDLQYLYAC